MSKTLCVLPFTHLATHPNGLVTPCCIANYENGISFSRSNNTLLNLNDNSLDEIMKSDSFTLLRENMLAGRRPIECVGCFKTEDAGFESKRIQENKKYLTDGITATSNEKFQFKFIELRLGNVCNLKCLSCNPMSSTKWIEDVKKMVVVPDKDHYNYENYVTEWYRDLRWYDSLLEHCDKLECVYINGGEPTLIKEHFYFLDKLIEKGLSKNIELIYNINCTNLPEKFINCLKYFKEVKLQLSIDDIGDRNYYIRYPASWDKIEENLRILNSETFNLSITQTISILNICNVYEFSKYFSDRKIEYNFVYTPKYLHISNLHPKLKKIAEEEISKLSDETSKNKLLSELYTQDTGDYEPGLNFIKMMDSIRNLSICNFLHEYEFLCE